MKTLIVCILLVFVLGCAETRPLAIQLHPTLGTSLMIVPKDNNIGHYKAPRNGVFMTDEVFFKMIQELLNQKDDVKTLSLAE